MRIIDQRPKDAMSAFSLAIFRLNGLLIQNGERITHPLGQSSARWQILARAGFQPQTVAQIARDLGQSRQSVQRIANALADEVLINYQQHPKDRRTQLLALTPKGEATLGSIYLEYDIWLQDVMLHFNEAELFDATNKLEDITRILKQRKHPG